MQAISRLSGRTTDGLAVFMLGGYSLLQFVRKSGTAWDWPALDMAPLVARQLDASFLANDFFTNASAEPNARHVFGHVLLTVAQLLGGDWYAAMFLLKVVAVVFLPVLWYLVLTGWATNWFDRGANTPSVTNAESKSPAIVRGAFSILAFIAILLVIRPSWGNNFSIAWWSPFQPQATSATYAQLCALVGCVAALTTSRLRNAIAIVAWFVASLLHPAIGLFMLALHAIAMFDTVRIRDLPLTAIVCWVVPCGILATVYKPTLSLTADEFIQHYVVGHHAAHYWPAEFGTLTGKPWWHSFALVAGAMLAAAAYGMATRNRRFATLALLCAATYVGCVGLQYFAVVTWPSKLLATIGPVRFSSLGYWQLALLASILAGDMVRRRMDATANVEQQPHALSRAIAAWGSSGVPRSWAIGLLLSTALYAGFVRRDDPIARLRSENDDFYAWVDKNTDAGSVFIAADSGLCVDLALVGRRAVFAGFGFPFREDFFAEHTERHELVYGTPGELAHFAGKSRGERSGKFFRALTPRDFVQIADKYRLDYVIVELPVDPMTLPEILASVPPRFTGKKFLVYAIDDWKASRG